MILTLKNRKSLRDTRLIGVMVLILVGLMMPFPRITVEAKVDLVTLPDRDRVQMTIYNTADLTLIREVRRLTLRRDMNRLQFGWANTLIDPTSVSLRALRNPDKVALLDVSFPPGTKGVAEWNIDSGIAGEEPVEITFFTSGISWNAFYLATLSPDEQAMDLEGYVRVTNRSGEDYANAQTRLLVGKINLIDQIIDLAKREYPYGRPAEIAVRLAAPPEAKVQLEEAERLIMKVAKEAEKRPKEIIKEALSEYFLYTIEGTETIPNGWGKRLPSFKQSAVPVIGLYKYDEKRWRDRVLRFVQFTNDEDHKMGKEPLPGGLVKVFRRIDEQGHLSYEGADMTRYIPIGEKVELNLGAARDVRVRPVLMEFRTDNFVFNQQGDVSGWDEHRSYRVEVSNFRFVPIKLEIWRHFDTAGWDLVNSGDYGTYEKVDLKTAKYSLELPPSTKSVFTYRVTIHHGQRAE
jgi:hypothetical protein